MQHVAMLHLPVRKSDCFRAVYLPLYLLTTNRPFLFLELTSNIESVNTAGLDGVMLTRTVFNIF